MLLLFALTSFLATNPSSLVDATSFGTRASPDSDVCDNINNCRRLFDIVWGCLTTVFACVWVSVHPNIPPPPPPALPKGASLWRHVKWKLIDTQGPLRSRLKLMLVGLLVPELIAGFAARQLAMAWHMSKSAEYEVSLTHGFFICMGGFVDRAGHPIVTFAQIDSEQDEASNNTLSAADQLLTNEAADLLPKSASKQSDTKALRAIQRTTKAAIQDKSKGDAFSKGIAFFQGLWFVVQCITRTAQHLPLTELEVATLAFAVVNIFTWSLWWSKPLDVRDPLVIEVSTDDTGPLQQPRPWMIKFGNLLGMTYDQEDYNPLANHAVPTFWFSSTWDSGIIEDYTRHLTNLGEFLVATIFGAIHCIAWHAAFPSIAELWLWRASAVLITGISLSLLASIWLTGLSGLVPVESFDVLFFFSILGYIPARLMLLVLPFTSLRALPSAAFVDVDWSVYIPHL
ncbi:hypothetical protein C8F01DRAFT_1232268 [Mycena amicta]|nr:hypothetical protein C8F01DRAFT_1232268 [Mycena amicta]